MVKHTLLLNMLMSVVSGYNLIKEAMATLGYMDVNLAQKAGDRRGFCEVYFSESCLGLLQILMTKLPSLA